MPATVNPDRTTTGHRRRTLRGAAAIAAAALIATGAYVATSGPAPAPPALETSSDVAPSAQIMRELRDSIAGQYGRAR